MSEWKSVPEYGSKGTLLVDDTQVEYATISHLQDLGYAVVPMHGLDSIVSLNTVPLRDRLAMAALPAVILAHREQGCVPREIAADLWPIVDAVLAARSAKGEK